MTTAPALPDHVLQSSTKLITCILPDDGRDKELLKELRTERGVITANTFQCRGLGPGTEKKGKKLSVSSVRVVTVVTPSEKADEIFEFIYHKMGFDNPIQESSIMYQGNLLNSTPFQLPEGVPDEASED